MPRKLRELRGDLKRAGFRIVHTKGSHEKWQHPLPGTIETVLSGADGEDAKLYQERDVLRSLRSVVKQELS